MGSLYDQARLPVFTCQGIECDYPTFASLGMNSSCQDVTNDTISECITSKTTNKDSCQLKTPAGAELYVGTFYSAATSVTHTNLNVSVEINARDRQRSANMSVVRIPSNNLVKDDWKTGMQVYDCGFQYSAIEYSGWRMINGTLLPGTRKPYAFESKKEQPPFSELLHNHTVVNPEFTHNRTFYISFWDKLYFQQVLEDAFPPASAGKLGAAFKSSALYLSEDIPTTIAKIGDAISDRMLSGPNAVNITGRTYGQEVFIVVQWAWISLPAALVLATCLFLAAVMLFTYKGDQLVWKSSLTPLLMTDVSYPLSAAHQRPVWSDAQRRNRAAAIVNHLTK